MKISAKFLLSFIIVGVLFLLCCLETAEAADKKKPQGSQTPVNKVQQKPSPSNKISEGPGSPASEPVFRTYRWGDPPSMLKKASCWETEDNCSSCVKTKEDFVIVGMKAERIFYYFFQDRLFEIGIAFSNPEHFQSLQAMVDEKYGQPSLVLQGFKKATWETDAEKIFLYETDDNLPRKKEIKLLYTNKILEKEFENFKKKSGKQ